MNHTVTTAPADEASRRSLCDATAGQTALAAIAAYRLAQASQPAMPIRPIVCRTKRQARMFKGSK